MCKVGCAWQKYFLSKSSMFFCSQQGNFFHGGQNLQKFKLNFHCFCYTPFFSYQNGFKSVKRVHFLLSLELFTTLLVSSLFFVIARWIWSVLSSHLRVNVEYSSSAAGNFSLPSLGMVKLPYYHLLFSPLSTYTVPPSCAFRAFISPQYFTVPRGGKVIILKSNGILHSVLLSLKSELRD